MSRYQVNYDEIAACYDERYESEGMAPVAAVLAAAAVGARRLLEVGCGTGHWLARLAEAGYLVVGLDLSHGMLGQAQGRAAPLHLAQGRAGQLPFAAGAFDLLYCVNAIHHFAAPERFVREAARLLAPGGQLLVIGLDPHEAGARGRDYIYDYFDGVYERDLARFPSCEALQGWLAAAGFQHVERRLVTVVEDHLVGRGVLDSPFLKKHNSSQLALLDDDAYAAGLARLRAAVAADETKRFEVALRLYGVGGRIEEA